MSDPLAMDASELKAWRKTRREHWIAWREALPASQREAWGRKITTLLGALLAKPQDVVVGFCWPYRAEFDARFAVRHWREQGAIAALPEVIGKNQPLRFRKWWPGAPMTSGVYDIPLPDGTPEVLPDVAIVPMNAFDERGYRLGYGGGFFDRTLAALERRVIAIGVTYDQCREASIAPQPYDLPMDFVVTEAGVHAAGGNALLRLESTAAANRLQQLMAQRRLPRTLHN